MINQRLQDKKLILASQSPRRQFLMKELHLDFEVVETGVTETYPDGLTPVEIAEYLAGLKAASLVTASLDSNTVVITADTLVLLDGEILGKPTNHFHAVEMLQKLSGRRHEVITAVCLKSLHRQHIFHVISSVYFKELTREEIDYYIANFQPFDKAGGYGIQEWIGYVGISKIEGSFFNVMGLPVKELYEELLRF